jgi:hypothetical protein
VKFIFRLNQWWVWGIACLLFLFVSSLMVHLQMLKNSSTDVQMEINHIQRGIQFWKKKQIELESLDRTQKAFHFLSQGRIEDSLLIPISEDLVKLAGSYGFDPLLILALVSVESQGKPEAIGRYRSGAESGAVGLMQIKWATAQEIAQKSNIKLVQKSDLLNPRINLVLGTNYLMYLVKKTQSLHHGIIAYNIGPGALRAYLRKRKKIPKRYLNRTLSNYRSLEDKFGSDPHSQNKYL